MSWAVLTLLLSIPYLDYYLTGALLLSVYEVGTVIMIEEVAALTFPSPWKFTNLHILCTMPVLDRQKYLGTGFYNQPELPPILSLN